MQHKAVYLLFCKFTLHVSGRQPHPPSGVHKTVTTASATGHTAKHKGEAVVTVLCTTDDGCG